MYFGTPINIEQVPPLPGTEAYNGAVTFLQIQTTFMPRFSITRSKKVLYASVRQKPMPKVTHMLRFHRPEAKNPLAITSLALGDTEPGPNRAICLGSINNRGHMV